MPGNEPAECRRPRVSSGALGDIVFGNPFSAERARGSSASSPVCRSATWTATGRRSPAWWSARVLQRGAVEDRRRLELTFLYVCYHRCNVSEGPPCVTCRSISASPFAGEAIAQLLRGDVSEERAWRVFGFVFQLRRAFYFIHRSLAGECES